MPTAERYASYRTDRVTIWVSKRAATVIRRERAPGESNADVIDRLFAELRARRRIPRGGGSAKRVARASEARRP